MEFLILSAILATASAQAIIGAVTTGRSDVSRSEDGLGNYAFGYNEDHAFGSTFRKEKGGPGVKIGSYGLREADGRMRVVNYVADGLGFRASVSTNEPGTDIKQDPAAVSMNLGGIAVAAPVAVAAAAPIAAAPVAMAAPIAAAATPVIAKSFGAPAIVGNGFAYGAPAAIAAAPMMARAAYGIPTSANFMAKAAIAAPIAAPVPAAIATTASSYATSINHIDAPKMIAHAAPVAAIGAAPFGAAIAAAPFGAKAYGLW